MPGAAVVTAVGPAAHVAALVARVEEVDAALRDMATLTEVGAGASAD